MSCAGLVFGLLNADTDDVNPAKLQQLIPQ